MAKKVSKKVLCIEVGLRFTRISEVMGYKATPTVYNCITFPTPEGAFEDGYIRDKASLGAAIRQQLSEHKIKTTDAIFTVNSTKIANREISIPYVKENKIQSIIELQASEYFPIDISEYNISYYILNKGEKAKGPDRKLKLLLLAAPNNLLQSYYNLAVAAGVHLEAIDYIGNSFYQIAKRQLNQGVNISIHINENTSLINIIENENLLLQRIIPYGANEVIERVRSNDVFKTISDEDAITLLTKEKLINYQFEPQKEDEIIYMSASEGYDQAKREIRAKEDITESLRFLVNNIIRVLDYFTAKNSSKKIGYIYISGLGAKFQGLVQLFKNELGFDARKIDNIYVASFTNKVTISKNEQPDYIACIGAGILPVGFDVKQKGGLSTKKTDIKNWKKLFVGSCVVGVAFIATAFGIRTTEDLKQKSLKKDIEKLRGIEAIYQESVAKSTEYTSINSVYESTVSRVDSTDIILKDIEDRIPVPMTVKKLEITQEGMVLDIETESFISIAKMLISFEEIPYLSDLYIDSIQNSISQERNGVQTSIFKVEANFNAHVIGEEIDQGNENNDTQEGNDAEASDKTE